MRRRPKPGPMRWSKPNRRPQTPEQLYQHRILTHTSWTNRFAWPLHFHDLRHDGVSRLFEMDWDIPRVASVSGHRDWNSMRRYTHLKGNGDPYKNWSWLETIVTGPIIEARKRIKRRGED